MINAPHWGLLALDPTDPQGVEGQVQVPETLELYAKGCRHEHDVFFPLESERPHNFHQLFRGACDPPKWLKTTEPS